MEKMKVVIISFTTSQMLDKRSAFNVKAVQNFHFVREGFEIGKLIKSRNLRECQNLFTFPASISEVFKGFSTKNKNNLAKHYLFFEKRSLDLYLPNHIAFATGQGRLQQNLVQVITMKCRYA